MYRCFLLLTLPWFIQASARSESVPALVARSDFNTALAELRHQGADRPSASPEKRLQFTAVLLNAQPRTTARTEETLTRARALQTDPSASNEIRASALFIEARILHEHVAPRRPEEAARCYQAMLDTTPLHPLAGSALVSLALIYFYDTPLPPLQRSDLAEKLLSRDIRPPARRELHYTIAQAQLALAISADKAAAHLQSALEIGFSERSRQADALLALGQLSQKNGRPALAIASYQKFLEVAFRDSRADTVRTSLADLEARSIPAL